jgi:hypothetical protein
MAMSQTGNGPTQDAGIAAKQERLRREFWPKLKRNLARLPFAEDLLAAYFCALDPTTPVRSKAILLGALAVPEDLGDLAVLEHRELVLLERHLGRQVGPPDAGRADHGRGIGIDERVAVARGAALAGHGQRQQAPEDEPSRVHDRFRGDRPGRKPEPAPKHKPARLAKPALGPPDRTPAAAGLAVVLGGGAV